MTENCGTIDLCEKCKKHPVEYDSPGNWCRYCWVDWWYEDDETTEKQEALRELEEKYGPVQAS